MKRILLVRHGESEWNAARRLQGQADIGLSPAGEAQALSLLPAISAHAPDLAVTSDLRRAVRTAELLGHAGAQRQPLLREQDIGQWQGKGIDSLMELAPKAYSAWRAGQFVPEGAESWQEFRRRIETAVDALLQLPASNILAVCHGGVIRAALDAFIGLSPDRIIPVGNASLTVLAFAGGRARLEAFNATGLLSALDAPQ